MDDPAWKVKSADSIQLNLGQETGEIHNGDLFLEDGHISMTGRRFQKFGGQTYHVDDGFFTTCLCESGAPSWKFSADQMDLALDGVGTVKNAYFYVLDYPVFYLPYGYFPINTERQTGLLFPRFGSSSKDGFRFAQPFYWAISKSSDATIEFDMETRSRFGFIGEYRKIFERQSDFFIHSSYFNAVQVFIQYFFNALGTKTALHELITATGHASIHRRVNITAIVTFQFIRELMVS